MARKKRITNAKIKKISKQIKRVIAKETDDEESITRIMEKIIATMKQEVASEAMEVAIKETPFRDCIVSSGAEADFVDQKSFVRTKGQSETSDSQKGVGID